MFTISPIQSLHIYEMREKKYSQHNMRSFLYIAFVTNKNFWIYIFIFEQKKQCRISAFSWSYTRKPCTMASNHHWSAAFATWARQNAAEIRWLHTRAFELWNKIVACTTIIGSWEQRTSQIGIDIDIEMTTLYCRLRIGVNVRTYETIFVYQFYRKKNYRHYVIFYTPAKRWTI